MRLLWATSQSCSQPELTESAVRRAWLPSALLVLATVAVGVLSYSLSMQVAAERRETEQLARQNSALSQALKSLDAELRVRMRLPQLQRWNDDVLGLMPINATQYLHNPRQLAEYADAPAPVTKPAPQVQYAVRDLAPRGSPAAPSPLREVKAEVAPPPRHAATPARVVATAQRVAWTPPARTETEAAPRRDASRPIARPQEAPADLLAQIEVTFAAPPGHSYEP